MKGGYTAVFNGPPAPAKRRRFAAAVLVLVLFSLLAPLAFLLGLYNHFPSGYLSDDRSTTESGLGVYKHHQKQNLVKGDQSRIDNLIKKFGPSFKKDIVEKINKSKGRKISSKSPSKPKKRIIKSEPLSTILEGFETIQQEITNNAENSIESQNYSDKLCEFQFGAYCLWSVQHKEKMKDRFVRRLKDQLFIARAYYPSIVKLKGSEEFSKEVKRNIQDHERMLGEAVSDKDLGLSSERNFDKMELSISKAKQLNVDSKNFERKLTQLVSVTESETYFHMRQSAFLYRLAVQTVPKTHHCFVLRLTVEWFKEDERRAELRERTISEGQSVRSSDFVVFSKNLLAVSVVINSTAMNLEESGNLVFHVLTDTQNFYAMKHFFARNNYKNALVHVLNYEQLKLNHENAVERNLFPSEEFRVMTRHTSGYISVFGHSNFLLSEIFPNLERVVVLEDDLVVQKDLSSLFEIDLEGKTIGAVEFCRVKLGQIKEYLNEVNYGEIENNTCLWLSGLNVVDLKKWRENNISAKYLDLIQKFKKEKEINEERWREISLPLSMVVFKDEIFPLETFWVQSNLGHDYAISNSEIQNAAILHYNGNMKPWLDMGIPKYKHHWRKYVTRTESYMDECNVNP
ncbi:hypothetical protein LUZ60_015480 [Juncus effusus]|nr:hypothetical protein LUZ60_015480 [Juncus effusus]